MPVNATTALLTANFEAIGVATLARASHERRDPARRLSPLQHREPHSERKGRAKGKMRKLPPAALQRKAGSRRNDELRGPHPAQRHPGAGRLLGVLVWTMQSSGANLRAGLLRVRARRPI